MDLRAGEIECGYQGEGRDESSWRVFEQPCMRVNRGAAPINQPEDEAITKSAHVPQRFRYSKCLL